MITLIEARNYRCLRSVSQPLGPFQLLVGPNATGKSTFLDVASFLGHLTRDGLAAAVEERTRNIFDLIWQREGDGFELAVELALPTDTKERLRAAYNVFRYEVAITTSPGGMIAAERGFLRLPPEGRASSVDSQKSLITEFGDSPTRVEERFEDRLVLSKTTTRLADDTVRCCDRFYVETTQSPPEPMEFCLSPEKSTLANLPEDESKFPGATWLKRFLTTELTPYQLDSRQLHAASPFARHKPLQPNATNLPWVIADFKETQPNTFRDWLAHLRIALPDLVDIHSILREDDRHRYLMLEYGDGVRVPSWFVSEGTLRLIALTLPAYLKDWRGTLLVEEPENGLHPRAIELAYQSLSSVYDGQVLMATHSPLFVRLVKPSEVLCFSKTDEGATEIIAGNQHPELADWHRGVDLGTLFASGVLE